MPDDRVIERSLEVLRRGGTSYQYFFEKLKSPDWIEPLNKAEPDIFRKPPAPEHKEGGWVRYPSWAASGYLARMASEEPELVLQIILTAEKTENIRVHEDFAEAALRMPAELAAKWVQVEIGWLAQQRSLTLPQPSTLGRLVSNLASGGEVKTALQLVRVLLESSSPRDDAVDDAGLPSYRTARLDEWDCSQLLRTQVTDLVASAGLDAYRLLCDVLDDYLTNELGTVEDAGGGDFSYIWRPAIEDHGQNEYGLESDIRNQLVVAIRSATESLIETDATYLEVILDDLCNRKWDVYQRLALHLLGRFRFAGQNELLSAWMVNADLVNNPAVLHESRALIKGRFGDLTDEDRQTLIGILAAWTPREEERLRAATEDEASWVTKSAERRRLASLSLISDWLDGAARADFEELRAEYGDVTGETEEFPAYTSTVGWISPASPLTDSQLAQLSVPDLISFIESSTLSKGSWDDSIEGLAKGLTADVERAPDKYSSEVEAISNLATPYLWGVLEGFYGAVKQQKALSWGAVLSLAERFVNEDHNEGEELERFGESYSSWARISIARLLGDGLEGRENSIPFDLREQVWLVLSCLTDDPQPDADHEDRSSGDNMDPFTLSLNTIRGEAMRNVVEYAQWVQRGRTAKGSEGFSFDDAPEVRAVLEAHLDPERDPSLAIRAVYGRWLPRLYFMDETWVCANLSRILPKGSEKQLLLRDAALSAYLAFNQPFDRMLDALDPYYRVAIAAIDSPATEMRRHPEALAAHLLPFYWRGLIPLDNETSLIRHFFDRSTDGVRSEAIRFAGQALQRTPRDVPEEVLDRLKKLWEWRISELASKSEAIGLKEPEQFGSWFISGKLDEAWALQQLLVALRLCKKSEPSHLVMQRLAERASTDTKDVLEALKLIAEGEEDPWGVRIWEKEARDILATAHSGSEEVKEGARSIASLLGARGFLGFREFAN